MGVTSLGRHTRPACHQALFEMFIKKKKKLILTSIQCVFSWTSGDARGLGLLFMVCACAVGLRGNVLIGMRGTWGVVWRSAHVSTIPFTWLRRAKALGPTAHASNHHATIGVFLWMRVFFTPWGHVNFHDHIWAFQRHLGHMTYMLDSDWLKKFLLRSDWLPTRVACITTIALKKSIFDFHFSLWKLTFDIDLLFPKFTVCFQLNSLL